MNVPDLSRQLRPTSDQWEWQLRGACRSADPEVFFHPELERGAARQRRDAEAVAVCNRCPVLDACRQHVMKYREPYGVWGGLTEEDRERLWSQRRRDERVTRRAG